MKKYTSRKNSLAFQDVDFKHSWNCRVKQVFSTKLTSSTQELGKPSWWIGKIPSKKVLNRVSSRPKRYFISLYSGDVNCALKAYFSACWDRKEPRTFKLREPLKAVLKNCFFLQGSTELNEPSGLVRQSRWLLQPVGSVVTLEPIRLCVSSQSSSSTRCADGAALPAQLISTYLHF